MRFTAILGLLLLAAPVAAQTPLPGASASALADRARVRVTARIVVVDREAVARAGLDYVVLGNDRVRVTSRDGRRARRGAGVEVGIFGVTAFLEAARENRWVRSESTQQVLTMSGGEALVSSTDLSVGRHAARTRGPSLAVIPTVLPDGSVHLRVSTRLEDAVTYGGGYGGGRGGYGGGYYGSGTYRVDGSPAAVDTEIIALEGEEVILANGSTVQTTRESGLLGWGGSEQGRDVLVAISVDVSP